MGYRELAPPPKLRNLIECGWERTASAAPARILPDGCMDLIRMDGGVVVAGPDSSAYLSAATDAPVTGLRFRPGVLPRLLGVPASALRNVRVPLADVTAAPDAPTLTALVTALAAAGEDRPQTAPWTLGVLRHVTDRLAAGAPVHEVAAEIGRSPRSMQRQCAAVYGYGPATVRRVLRFRRAVGMVRAGVAVSDAAARAGYADQPHLYREVREFAGVPLPQLCNAANRSTEVPSGSVTVA